MEFVSVFQTAPDVAQAQELVVAAAQKLVEEKTALQPAGTLS